MLALSLPALFSCSEPKDLEESGEIPDRSDELYERSRLLEIQIDIASSDWDALRFQERTDLWIQPPDCALPPSPFTWFTGEVRIDGEVFGDVGMRKKGFFGSMSDSKPSLKIRLDKYIDGQELLDVKRITLNNSIQDGSYVRQCLSYDLFRAAGVPAPRCNFAHVFVNGEDLGVYTHIESIKKPFLRRNFGDEDGILYEGTLSDFREGWTGTFEQKTNEDQPDTRVIDAISDALAGSDEDLLGDLDETIDLDAFFTFWAVETITAHWDGYAGNTNNFHLYGDPSSGKAYFIPWGTDGTFIEPLMLFEDRYAPRSINAAGLLARRLYLHPEGQERYLEHLLYLLDVHWDAEELQESIQDMSNVFGPSVPDEEIDWVQESLDETQSFIDGHAGLIRSEIEGGPEEWDVPLRDSFCSEEGWSQEDGAEWNATIFASDGYGYVEYYRLDDEGECYVYGDLTGLSELEGCGDGCSFGMEMSVGAQETDGDCSDDEMLLLEGEYAFGQSTEEIGEYEGSPVYLLLQRGTDGWDFVSDSYSLLFDTGWYFGAEL
jgi:hypothetical protein